MTAWNQFLREQFEGHWERQLRSRLEGLTDQEYLWEPVAGAWSVRPRGSASTSMAVGAGELLIDWAYPEPIPAPFTTIAWRLGHVIVGVLGMRNAAHFGRDPVDYATFSYAATAAGALAHTCFPDAPPPKPPAGSPDDSKPRSPGLDEVGSPRALGPHRVSPDLCDGRGGSDSQFVA